MGTCVGREGPGALLHPLLQRRAGAVGLVQVIEGRPLLRAEAHRPRCRMLLAPNTKHQTPAVSSACYTTPRRRRGLTSVRFSPTHFWSRTASMPRGSSCARGPTPERRSSCGVLIAPAQRTTSLRAAARKRGASGACASSMPEARGGEPDSDVNRMRVAVVLMRTCRFGRASVSVSRKAVAAELPGTYRWCNA
jgi:hypothetical protein